MKSGFAARLSCCLVLMGCLIAFMSAQAADEKNTPSNKIPLFEAAAEVDKGFVTIGDKIRYQVTVLRPEGDKLLGKIEFPNSRDFAVKKVTDIPEKKLKDGRIQEGRLFEISAYALGEYIIPEGEINYLPDGGKERKSLKTQRFFITVESVDKGKKKTDIRGIKGPGDYRINWKPLIWTVSAVISLIFLAILFIYWRHRKLLALRAEEKLTLHERTVRDLNRLFGSNLLHEGKVREYFYSLSDIIKRYFTERYLFPATDKTTAEIIAVMREKDIAPETLKLIRSFFDEVDIIKFAKYSPQTAEVLSINKNALGIVEQTKPVIIIEDSDLAKAGSKERK